MDARYKDDFLSHLAAGVTGVFADYAKLFLDFLSPLPSEQQLSSKSAIILFPSVDYYYQGQNT